MAKVTATKSTTKDTTAPVAKSPAPKKAVAPKAQAPKAAPAKSEAPKATSLNTAPKAAPAKPAKPAPKPKKPVEVRAIEVKNPAQPKSSAKVTSTGKTIYHVSKRGESKADREWKVFIQGSDKVIKLFDTQQEALDYAKGLADNKNDGSTVMLHGLDGKIRKY